MPPTVLPAATMLKASGEGPDRSGGENEAGDGQGFLIQAARAPEILGEPELEKVPDRIGEQPPREQQPQGTESDELPPRPCLPKRRSDPFRSAALLVLLPAIEQQPRNQPEESDESRD